MKQKNKSISVAATFAASLKKTWEIWTDPKHIVGWNQASDDWHTTKAENDLRIGGKFLSRMEAKDGSFGFDFERVYTKVPENELIEYTIADGRKVSTSFKGTPDGIMVTTEFEPESENPVEMQRGGWQAILDNFKKYAEASR